MANPQSRPNQIRESAIGVILATAESMRFQNIRFAIIQSEYLDFQFSNSGEVRIFSRIEQGTVSSWDFFRSIITNWDSETQQAIRYFENNEGDLTQYFNHNILVRAAIITIFALSMYSRIQNCNLRIIRSINNKVCSIQRDNICNYNTYFVDKNKELYSIACQSSEIKKVNIQGKITTMKIVNTNNSGNLKIGDFFVGTTEGLYLIRENGISLKADNIDNEVTSIKEFGIGNFYVSTKDEQIYFLNTKLINNNYPLIAEELFDFNLKSSNLNKEWKLYYDEKYQNKQLDFEPVIHNYWNSKSFLLNLDKINPIDNYQKLEFIGDVDSNCWGTIVNWGSWFYTNDCDANWGKIHKLKGKSIKTFFNNRNNNFLDIIENTKNDISQNKEQELQKFWDKDGEAKIEVNQRFGLTWYWENKKYYLKVFGLQYCNWWASAAAFNCHIKMGNGIRLYNDDENIRTKREIFEEKNDLKNVTKWTDDFTESINHEQHLPITNNSNFVNSNITNL